MLMSWWRRWMPCSAVDWTCLASYQYPGVGEGPGDMTWRQLRSLSVIECPVDPSC